MMNVETAACMHLADHMWEQREGGKTPFTRGDLQRMQGNDDNNLPIY